MNKVLYTTLKRGLFIGGCFLSYLASYTPLSASPAYEQRLERLKQFRLTQPYIYDLPNGLKLLVYLKKDTPIVAHSIWYNIGAADEQAGETGLAHFFEHLMFKGTHKHPHDTYSQYIASVGGYENAYTTSDYTVYYQNVPKTSLEKIMNFEADRMVNLDIPEKEFYHERDVVLEERSMRVDNDPASLLAEQMAAMLYRNHPYGKPVIGWRHEIEQLNLKSAQKFYKKYYVPNNAIVTVVGDVVPEQVYQTALKTYGKNKANPELVIPQRPQEPEQKGSRMMVYKDKNTSLPMLFYYAQGSGYGKNPKDLYKLVIGLKALGDGTSSYLFRKLVNQEQQAVAFNIYVPSETQDSSTIMISMVGDKQANLDKMKQRLIFNMKQAISKRLLDDEIAIAQQNLISDFIYASDGRGNLARFFGVSLLNTGQVKDILEFPKMIGDITPQEVYDVLESTLTDDNQVIGYLQPDSHPQ